MITVRGINDVVKGDRLEFNYNDKPRMLDVVKIGDNYVQGVVVDITTQEQTKESRTFNGHKMTNIMAWR